jgi:hypothetical protein
MDGWLLLSVVIGMLITAAAVFSCGLCSVDEAEGTEEDSDEDDDGRPLVELSQPFERWLLVTDDGHDLQSCVGYDIAQRYQPKIAVPTRIVHVTIAAGRMVPGSRHLGSAALLGGVGGGQSAVGRD